MLKVVLDTPQLLSSNKFYAGLHRSTRQKIVNEWHTSTLLAVRQQHGTIELTDPPYFIVYKVYSPNNRMDISNVYIKVIEDGLVLAGVLADDNLKYVKGYMVQHMGVDKINPRIEVNILRMKDELGSFLVPILVSEIA